jgi:hypothetical protein
MPWDSKSFQKHNHKLKGHAAEVGAAAATSALKEGKDEGTAIRIGNAAGDKAMKKKKGTAETLYKDSPKI